MQSPISYLDSTRVLVLDPLSGKQTSKQTENITKLILG